jgi:hypothetical protein
MTNVGTATSRSAIAGLMNGVVAFTVLSAGCDRFLPQRDQPMPPLEEVERIYNENGLRAADISFDGNVIVIRASQDPEHLRRGGSLWARVGPYIYTFNPGTQIIWDRYPGVAAVRAITTTESGTEVARATLRQGELNELTWRRTLNLLGHAINEGTRRPSLLLDLVEWGEEHTTFRYNREFVPEARS